MHRLIFRQLSQCLSWLHAFRSLRSNHINRYDINTCTCLGLYETIRWSNKYFHDIEFIRLILLSDRDIWNSKSNQFGRSKSIKLNYLLSNQIDRDWIVDIRITLFDIVSVIIVRDQSEPNSQIDIDHNQAHYLPIGLDETISWTNMGGLKWELVLCLAAAWTIVCLCLIKGNAPRQAVSYRGGYRVGL